MTQAFAIFLLCTLSGGNCIYNPSSHVTGYAPELGGINGSPPYDMTAYMEPIEYGVTYACGPDIPYGVYVYVEGIGYGQCLDLGGAIDNDEIDIAVLPDDVWMVGNRDREVVWVFE